MNRIDELFKRKKESILSIYFTAGYPELNDTTAIIEGLEKSGADLIEIGFPFSDPVADGPVIQASSHQALENGMNLDVLFGQLLKTRGTSKIAKIMMGYFNTVYQYQVDRFIDQCVACGIDGVIIPDLPPEVFVREYQKKFESAGVHFICLVAPQTSNERANYIKSVTSGFLYRLSMSATTGSPVRDGLSAVPVLPADPDYSAVPGLSVVPILHAAPDPGALPSLIGFGIHDHETFENACKQANGAIIGTAFIRHLNEGLLNQKGKLNPDGKLNLNQSREQLIQELCAGFVGKIRGK